jgi:acetyl-CoA carboxylase biotin carboxyl carrier protein
MSEVTLIVGLERSAAGRARVTAPALGRWSDAPARGTLVGGGSCLGRLRCLNRSHRLMLPEGVAGVVDDAPQARVRAVSFGEILFHLRPLEDEATQTGGAANVTGDTTDVPQGAHAVRAPTDGVFYGRPGPDTAPFVEIGTRVRQGQPVGLVEVMKTFNQIVYGGAGLPEEAEVIDVRCEDGAEIAAGQPLIIVR